MPILTIIDGDREILKMEIPQVDPAVVVAAIAKLPRPRKPRSDRGKKRQDADQPQLPV